MTKDQISLNICISFFLTAQICILFRYFYLAALWVVLGHCCCCTIGAADSILSHLSQCMSAVNFIPVFDFISEPALRSYFIPDALIFALVPQ